MANSRPFCKLMRVLLCLQDELDVCRDEIGRRYPSWSRRVSVIRRKIAKLGTEGEEVENLIKEQENLLMDVPYVLYSLELID